MEKTRKKITEGILYTDFYQLTMAQLYYSMGMHQMDVEFEYFFRNYPGYDSQPGGYCINAGLEWLLEWMEKARFGEEEIGYLRGQKGRSGRGLFREDFLEWLAKNGDFSGISIRAIPEGRVVHPNVPLAVVRGPFAMAQVLESSLLNHLNYQTLIATKASRVREAAMGGMVIDFGLRRGQDKGANAGARAALIGGAQFSSNTGISYYLGYPPKGTHAHSMVQAFMAAGEGELEAFMAYAEVYPDDCLLLVDTVDTLKSGVPNAIKVFEKLRKQGHEPVGIRLDSGDLAYLAIQSVKMLDKAGFGGTSIVLSNKLDEMVIWQILTQIRKEAGRYGVDANNLIERLVYGVGTRLITSKGDAALDGVYKLTAISNNGSWAPAIKLSESVNKIINPSCKNVWRIYDRRNIATSDLLGLCDEDAREYGTLQLRHPIDPGEKRTLSRDEVSEIEPLLADVMKEGKIAIDLPKIEDIRKRRDEDIKRLDPGVKRLVNPHRYHVSLTPKLFDLKQELIRKEKEKQRTGSGT
ncbi:MAG: nicotinate phosphoribosyltransferase [Candidatus Omnitrophica bacterium]|nr:nicotinate phosphoribosyltransferase [Candidatus Omnitrophota bacterium]